MKKVRFTEGEIIGTLREHEAGNATADVYRRYGGSGDVLQGEGQVRLARGARNGSARLLRRPAALVA